MGEAAEDEENHKEEYVLGAPPRDNLDIPVTKRYMRRPVNVIIPQVIPWENSAALQTQHLMSSFGSGRSQVTPVEDGAMELKQGAVHSETILTRFAETNAFANQGGAAAFGKHRDNVTHFISSKPMDPEKARLSESVNPLQSGTNAYSTKSGDTPIGAIRNQVPLVKYRADMSGIVDPKSDTFLARLCVSNPNNKAGTAVIGMKRQATPRQVIKHVAETESILPAFHDRFGLAEPTGTGAGIQGMGQPRQVVTVVDDGDSARQTYEDLVASKKYVPWALRGDMTSQEGSGGFGKVRDVVPPIQPILYKQPKKKF